MAGAAVDSSLGRSSGEGRSSVVGNTLGWAIFLAASWIWCIGMYLPDLLARDGGFPYFLAFFVPNVLGAASVGYVLRTRTRSALFVRSMRVPMLVFSGVTVGFQAFFLAWKMADDLKDGILHLPAGIAFGAMLVGVVTLLRTRVDWVPAITAVCCSVLAGGLLVARPVAVDASEPMIALLGLSMVTALGFGICPYLDLSFNRAVQHAKSPPAAFGIEFLIFAAIILIVTRGRMIFWPTHAETGARIAPPFEMGIDWVLGATGLHYGAQAAFTVLAHTAAVYALKADGSVAGLGEEIDARDPGRPSVRKWIFGPAFAGLLIGVGVAFAPMVDLPGFVSAISAGEFGYRLILGAYGLLFPVWALTALGRRMSIDRGTLMWTAGVCALAGPFLWIGSIGRDEVWLIPGVSLILLAGAARLALRTPAERAGL